MGIDPKLWGLIRWEMGKVALLCCLNQSDKTSTGGG